VNNRQLGVIKTGDKGHNQQVLDGANRFLAEKAKSPASIHAGFYCVWGIVLPFWLFVSQMHLAYDAPVQLRFYSMKRGTFCQSVFGVLHSAAAAPTCCRARFYVCAE
jgi:hypothetical protein